MGFALQPPGRGRFVQIDLGKLKENGKLKERPEIGGAVTMDHRAWSADGNLLFLLSSCALDEVAPGLPAAHIVAVPGHLGLLRVDPQQHGLILAEDGAPIFCILHPWAVGKVEELRLSATAALEARAGPNA